MEVQVCKKFCSFYRPGRKLGKCGSYDFLKRNLTTQEMRAIAGRISRECDFSEDESIKSMACKKCGFFKEDCDFRQGLDSPPCGGYTVLEHLLKSG